MTDDICQVYLSSKYFVKTDRIINFLFDTRRREIRFGMISHGIKVFKVSDELARQLNQRLAYQILFLY